MSSASETADRLNAEVTAAIMEAEKKSLEAAQAWERVAKAEHALSQCPDISDAERAIALRGPFQAQGRATLLRMWARATGD